MTSLVKLEELITELGSKIDSLATKENLEAIAAKIIIDVLNKVDKNNKELLEEKLKHKRKIFEDSFQKEESRFRKYSYPNFYVGNPSLGNSRSKNALTWPFDTTS